MSVKILLVGDQKIIGDLLDLLIENTPGMKVVAETENGRTVLDNQVYPSSEVDDSVSKDSWNNTCRKNSGPLPS